MYGICIKYNNIVRGLDLRAKVILISIEPMALLALKKRGYTGELISNE